MFQIGDKVIVGDEHEMRRMIYPFMPDLSGKEGEVIDVQTESSLGSRLEEAIYLVKFDPFKIGIIPDDGHAVDDPTEWRDECLFSFMECDLTKVEI